MTQKMSSMAAAVALMAAKLAFAGSDGGCQPVWSQLPSGPSAPPSTIFPVIEGGRTVAYASGAFGHVGNTPVPGFARWDGQSWSLPGSATYRGLRSTTMGNPVLAVYDTDNGPRLHTLCPEYGLQIFSGSQWSDLAGSVRGLRVDSSNAGLVSAIDNGQQRLFVGAAHIRLSDDSGQDDTFNNAVASWDGSAWTLLPPFPALTDPAMRPATQDLFRALDVGDGRRVYVSLRYSSNQTYVPRIARLDNGAWTMLDDGVDFEQLRGPLQAMSAVAQGPAAGVYTGFATIGTVTLPDTPPVNRWTGTAWVDVVGIDGSRIVGNVASLESAFINGQHVLLAGSDGIMSIGYPDSTTVPSLIAAWDGERWESVVDRLASDTTSVVQAMSATRQRGQPLLLLAGQFANVAGVPSWNFAQATLCTSMCAGDVNFDGHTDVTDLSQLLANFGTTTTNPNFGPDINDDGVVNNADLSMMLAAFGYGC